ncbi:MAG TPA: hypothetical protein VGW38_28280, partial [Chloroflexota bacterium]|nr:hypothetical protein [Chloroflexota bacterium]
MRHDETTADPGIITAAGDNWILGVVLGVNIALAEQVTANVAVVAAYASDAEAERRIPFWRLLFKNVVLCLVGSDRLPAAAKATAVAHISALVAAGRLCPDVARRFPLK